MSGPNSAQAEHWSSAPGEKWVEHEDKLDALMAPVLEGLLEEVALQPGETALDIGCGTGASTLEAAQAVGETGHVTALDISPVLLARAKARAEEAGLSQTSFILGDAQVYGFEPGSMDAILSRFGVMFFSDPVAAFANIASALRPGGRLAFMCWGGAAGNPWFSIPNAAAVERLGKPEPSDPRAPGPMAFAEPDYVSGILTSAGLADVTVEPVSLHLTPKGSLAQVAKFSAYLGPAVRLLQEKGGTKEDAAAIAKAVEVQLEQFETEAGLRIPADLNLVTARRG